MNFSPHVHLNMLKNIYIERGLDSTSGKLKDFMM